MLKFRLAIVRNGGAFFARRQENWTLLGTVQHRLSASAVRQITGARHEVSPRCYPTKLRELEHGDDATVYRVTPNGAINHKAESSFCRPRFAEGRSGSRAAMTEAGRFTMDRRTLGASAPKGGQPEDKNGVAGPERP